MPPGLSTIPNSFYGILSLLIASISISAVNVLLGGMAQSVSPFITTFLAFFLAGFFFIFLNKGLYPPTVDKRAIIAIATINITSASTFICLYFAISLIEPSVACAVQAGITPIIATALKYYKSKKNIKALEACGALLIFTGCIYLAFTSFHGESGIGKIDINDVALGFLCVITSGISMMLLAYHSKYLSLNCWTTLNILGHRFYATFFVGILWLYFVEGPSNVKAAVEQKGVSELIMLISALGLTLPLLLIQTGIKLVSPFLVLVMTNLNPVITFAFQSFDPRISFSYSSAFGILMVFLGILSVLGSGFFTSKPFIQNLAESEART